VNVSLPNHYQQHLTNGKRSLSSNYNLLPLLEVILKLRSYSTPIRIGLRVHGALCQDSVAILLGCFSNLHIYCIFVCLWVASGQSVPLGVLGAF
jgi:hypothetical protein